MWLFYSRIYATQLWRYVTGLLEHNSNVAEDRSESLIVHPFADVDDQINAFCTAFTDLRKDFDSRLSLSTALVLSRTASSVDMIGMYAYTFSRLCRLTTSTQYVIKC
jgi:hypothetical protein